MVLKRLMSRIGAQIQNIAVVILTHTKIFHFFGTIFTTYQTVSKNIGRPNQKPLVILIILEEKLQFLQFVTGTTQVPYEGFSGLRGPNGPKPFCIEQLGNKTDLPRAHTCFNRIDLPNYMNLALMTKKINYAIRETAQFGLE